MDLMNALAHTPSEFSPAMLILLVAAVLAFFALVVIYGARPRPRTLIVGLTAFFLILLSIPFAGNDQAAYTGDAVAKYVHDQTGLVPMSKVEVKLSQRHAAMVAVKPNGDLVDVVVEWLPVDTHPVVPGTEAPAGFNPVTMTTVPHDPNFTVG